MDLDRFIKQDIVNFLEGQEQKDIEIKGVRDEEMSLFDFDRDYSEELSKQLNVHNSQRAKDLFDELIKGFNAAKPEDPSRKKMWSILREMFDKASKYLKNNNIEGPLLELIKFLTGTKVFETESMPEKIPVRKETAEMREIGAQEEVGLEKKGSKIKQIGSKQFTKELASEIARDIPLEELSELSQIFSAAPRPVIIQQMAPQQQPAQAPPPAQEAQATSPAPQPAQTVQAPPQAQQPVSDGAPQQAGEQKQEASPNASRLSAIAKAVQAQQPAQVIQPIAVPVPAPATPASGGITKDDIKDIITQVTSELSTSKTPEKKEMLEELKKKELELLQKEEALKKQEQDHDVERKKVEEQIRHELEEQHKSKEEEIRHRLKEEQKTKEEELRSKLEERQKEREEEIRLQFEEEQRKKEEEKLIEERKKKHEEKLKEIKTHQEPEEKYEKESLIEEVKKEEEYREQHEEIIKEEKEEIRKDILQDINKEKSGEKLDVKQVEEKEIQREKELENYEGLVKEMEQLEIHVDRKNVDLAKKSYMSTKKLFNELPYSKKKVKLYKELLETYYKIKNMKNLPTEEGTNVAKIKKAIDNATLALDSKQPREAMTQLVKARAELPNVDEGKDKKLLNDILEHIEKRINDQQNRNELQKVLAGTPLEYSKNFKDKIKEKIPFLKSKKIDIKSLYQEGLYKLYNKENQEAAEIFQEILKAHPGHLAARIRLREATGGV